jgi:AraC-like DNA-binding protein
LNKVPTAHFDSDQFSLNEGLAAWRQMTASLYQTWPRGEPERFRAEAAGYKVGELVFNQVQFTPARFLHGPELLVGEGKDFLSLQAQLAGEERLIMAHGHVRLLAGHIYLRDWAYAFDSEASAMRLNAIMIPRHRLRAGAGMQEHTPVLSWSMADPDGRLLAMLWQALLADLGQVTLPQARTLCDAFLGFLDALLGYGPTLTRPASLGAMQQFLMTRLHGDVGVEALCRHFHVSRSTVYRLFEPLGGVRQFINGARLERCYGELREADPQRVKIADIAAAWGFTDASSFSRRFRSRFGVSPSEVLGTALDQSEDAAVRAYSAGARLNRDYTDWLEQASGRAASTARYAPGIEEGGSDF